MPNTEQNSKESTCDGEGLLLLVVGLFFIGGEMTMSDNGWEVVPLMMVDVKGTSVSLLVEILGGLIVPLVMMIDEGCMEGEISFIGIVSVIDASG